VRGLDVVAVDIKSCEFLTKPRCLRVEKAPWSRMPPVEDDDALVGIIIHEKAAAAGVVHDTSLHL
jgi:hypothetical protein